MREVMVAHLQEQSLGVTRCASCMSTSPRPAGEFVLPSGERVKATEHRFFGHGEHVPSDFERCGWW
ncbi:MAG: hypothetical protein ACRDJ4_14395 [Actinomycetota bacterium]